MTDRASIRIKVYGLVQGVNFRHYTSLKARELSLNGYVKNLPGGKTVEVYAEGESDKLDKLISHLKVGPPRAAVEKVDIEHSNYSGIY
ncbi:MAG: acylphosphatase, partial [Dehalococcoidales bacterium]|nr:acylphosphatase [Dehalococcoidales bacterium]